MRGRVEGGAAERKPWRDLGIGGRGFIFERCDSRGRMSCGRASGLMTGAVQPGVKVWRPGKDSIGLIRLVRWRRRILKQPSTQR